MNDVNINRRIFHSIFGTSLIVLFAAVLMLMSVLVSYFSKLQLRELHAETELAARGAELGGAEYLESIDPDLCRVTWVDSDGTLIFDNAADISSMENHLGREEIHEALADGYGESTRYSETLSQKYMYTAIRLSDGSVIRLSGSQDAVWMLLLGVSLPICITVCIAIVLSLILAAAISGKVTEKNGYI